ncbi:hypothetical protein FGG08_005291 [Glutinoglossum americanum]|uniref:sn-1-specific diacylglycerol lipase n=1 Tax=Glutinoglossum americanum TaxID=1670608 RepID=A0A9P8L306_9PEZI|nr:hypothetical protein FGG08_005291 [Glutinoglossum americanum]
MAGIRDEEHGVSPVDVDPHGLRRPDPVRTLLPSPIASIVSLATRSSSIYLRIGTFIGGLALDGARITTLTSLEIGRSMVEGVLLRAGRDVASRSSGQMGKLEAENVLEKSIIYLHSTFTKASFVASTGFSVSSAALLSASSLSMHLLYALDSILGSTESSRAIASIITLIRHEFRNPETGAKGERVGVADLLIGISGLALVQGWCRNRTERLVRESCTEEAVWDVVVLDNGRRADVVAVNSKDQTGEIRQEVDGREGVVGPWKKKRATSFVSTTGGPEVIQAIEHMEDSSEPVSSIESQDQSVEDTWPERELSQHLMAQLPSNAKVSVTTSIRTTKTVTVEVLGAEPPDLSPPPGAVIIEESSHYRSAVNTEANTDAAFASASPDTYSPRYRVVYQITRNKSRRASIGGEGDAVLEFGEQISPHVTGDSVLAVRGSLLPATGNDGGIHENVSKGVRPWHHRTAPRTPLAKARKPNEFHPDIPSSKESESIRKSNTANQKRPRKPVSSSSSHNASDEAEKGKTSKRKSSLPKTSHKAASEKTEKMKTLRRAFRKGTSSTALANLWGKESPSDTVQNARKGKEQRPPWGSSQGQFSNKSNTGSSLPVPQWQSSLAMSKDLPRAPPRGNPNYFSSRDLGQGPGIYRSPSGASYYSIHERRRDSLVSQTDTYSIQPAEQLQPGSPSHLGKHAKSSSSLLRAKSAKDVTVSAVELPARTLSKNHRRSKSYAPSICTLHTNDSETSLALVNPHPKSAFDDHSAIMSLNRSGYVPNLFPQSHFVHNIVRFMRFASASYGSNFLRLMGITSQKRVDSTDADTLCHPEQHDSFARHVGLPASTILVSSHLDPQGGSNSTGETDTGVPMVHFVSLDHSSKAVVLTCRGTLGFEDVLTDLSCEYDDIVWRHRTYKVHKGMHASARKLLEGGGGKVMSTIQVALEEYPEYGLILCGHSLGAGVTAILSILLSEPDVTGLSGSAFVTTPSPSETPLLMSSATNRQKHSPSTPQRLFWLPGGRPIHTYAYGPPGTVSSSLRIATRGLITTIVNGQDLVPHLSLGVLHDLQGVALAFKTDTSGAKSEIRKRFWAGLTGGLTGELFGQPCGRVGEENDDWALSALKSLRVNMLSTKLMPPGEVFVIETMPVLQRDAFTPRGSATADGYPRLGRPATRAVLKLIKDVDGKFGEVRFGGSMLGDHSPGRYERSLSALGKGVLGDEG